MQAKDLRIDNWFYAVHPVDGLFEMQVRGIAQDGTIETDAYGNTYGTCDCDINSVKPIPLTEEWLLRFGFELTETNYDGGHHYWIWDFSGILLTTPYEDDSVVELGDAKFKYVHQLQNLYFALTGKELEIK